MTQQLTRPPSAQLQASQPGRDLPAGLVRGVKRVRRRVPVTIARRRRTTGPLWIISVSLQLLALLAGVFFLELVPVGALRHQGAQSDLYARYRIELAEQTAPLGQLDYNGTLLALGAPVAVIDIPRLHVREVVGEGTTANVLMNGLGHRRDTPLPGQFGTSIVFGRGLTYGAPLHGLSSLRVGDEILATTGQSAKPFHYTVVAVRRAGEPVLPLAAGTSRLTLTTSDGPWYAPSGVLRVDATLDGAPMARTAKQFSKVPAAEQAMGTDRTSLTALLLWAQALLVAMVGFVLLRSKWGVWQAWVVGAPVLLLLGLSVAHEAAALLPNLL